MARIVFYRNKCIGCNACVEADFSRWRISQKDGKCCLVGAKENKGIYSVTIREEELAANQLAERTCPVRCIKVC